jgi:phosphatidylinositol glycan class B
LERLLAVTVGVMVMALSAVSHKEVRFVYPLLPLLHVLAAPVIAGFFYTTANPTTLSPSRPPKPQ